MFRLAAELSEAAEPTPRVHFCCQDAKRKDRDAPAAADATPSASGQSKSKKAKKKAAQQQQQEAAAATTGAIDDDTKPITAAAEAADPYPDLAEAATEYIPLGELKAEPGRGGEAGGATAAAAKPAAAAAGAKAGADDEDRALREAGQKPYWMSYCCNISSPLLRLHQGEVHTMGIGTGSKANVIQAVLCSCSGLACRVHVRLRGLLSRTCRRVALGRPRGLAYAYGPWPP